MMREKSRSTTRSAMRFDRGRALVAFASVVAILLCVAPPAAQTTQQSGQSSQLPSETPQKFQEVTNGFDYVRRDVMIPMRDGVMLHTVILVPKGAKGEACPGRGKALGQEGKDTYPYCKDRW